MPRVSVVTPFLNAEAHLAEAIASVWAQTVADWELILVDDGSTDRSRPIASAAAAADTRIRLVDRPPGSKGGAAAARNAGMGVARGGFLVFLDADDLFEPDMLAVTLAAAEANPEAAMVFGPTRWWYPKGQRRDWTETTDGRAGRLHAPPSLLRKVILLQDGHVPCTCSVLVRRAAIKAVGGFEERFRLYEDQALWVKLFLRYPVFVTPVCLSSYRQHAGSVSTVAAASGLYDRMGAHPARAAFLDWVAAYVAESGLSDPRLRRAIRLARAPYVNDPSLRTRLDRLALALRMRLARLCRRRRRFVDCFGRTPADVRFSGESSSGGAG